ncbi:uncharacterized [Tachysurus ichikawai]
MSPENDQAGETCLLRIAEMSGIFKLVRAFRDLSTLLHLNLLLKSKRSDHSLVNGIKRMMWRKLSPSAVLKSVVLDRVHHDPSGHQTEKL